ncbi:hypothetical protein [Nocardia sp. AB354]|uniref:hypothetical protein n=1 Tax=Nocardia sp. AB354 TaxID=3413283 RepID=UPI003C1A7C6F
MASGDDQGRDEGESEFGPPVSGFGPPLNDFGPPTGETGAVGWAPVGEPERPTLGWQPADTPATPSVPPPPAQYRAPDSTAAPETVRHSAPEAPRAPETVRTPAPETVRTPAPETRRVPEPPHGTDAARAPETVRYPDAGGADADRGTWWRADDSGFPPTPPRETTGSLWDDDELAKKLAPSRPPGQPQAEARPDRNMPVILAGAAGAVVIVIALVLIIVFATRSSDGDGSVGGGKSSPPSVAALSCPARTDGNVVIGNGPGDTNSGSAAILGFQHAFYADRSGVKAHDFVAPDASNVSTASTMQQAIDSLIPQGTTYCLRVETVTPEQFNVDLTEHRPDGTTTLYKQLVKTVNREGKNLIFSIDQR